MESIATLKSFIPVAENCDFPIQNLPYGIFSDPLNTSKRVGVAIGEWILDLATLSAAGLFNTVNTHSLSWFNTDTLNVFMSQGPKVWQAIRSQLLLLLSEDCPILRDNNTLKEQALIARQSATLYLPFYTRDYTDFYSGIHHAENVGRLFRDKDNPLLPNYRHIPVGYHGRASSLVVSGTPIKRPYGQMLAPGAETPHFNECKRLDFELELGTVIGVGNVLGEPIDINHAMEHVFGVVLVNDWSARDIQQWEYVPLGPFLGKSFATTLSPWVVTLEALEPFKVSVPLQTPEPLPYLIGKSDNAYDIKLQIELTTKENHKPQIVCQTNTQELYWTQAQQVAHHTINGCNLQTGDLLASGTISGTTSDSFGSLLEITEGGKKPLQLDDKTERRFLEDGDTVIMKAWCEKANYPRIGFGVAVGTIQHSVKPHE